MREVGLLILILGSFQVTHAFSFAGHHLSTQSIRSRLHSGHATLPILVGNQTDHVSQLIPPRDGERRRRRDMEELLICKAYGDSPVNVNATGPLGESKENTEMKKLLLYSQRRHDFSYKGVSGATTDRMRFSGIDKIQHNQLSPNGSERKWIVIDESAIGVFKRGLLNKTIPICSASGSVNRTVAKAAFQLHEILGLPALTKEEKISQWALLLRIPTRSAKAMMRKAPSLLQMKVDERMVERCIDISLILRCDPKQFVTVVQRWPSLLTCRATTIHRKLLLLDVIVSGVDVSQLTCEHTRENSQGIISEGSTIGTARSISDATLSVVHRVPRLLGVKSETLVQRLASLRNLHLLGGPSGIVLKNDTDHSTTRVLRRCPELLLYDIEETIIPKIEKLESIFQVDPTTIICREPRLLLYDPETSLGPKARIWRDRVEDAEAFDLMVLKYPTLLMYSFGAAARLDYFSNCLEGKRPSATEARQLIMLSKASLDHWGESQERHLASIGEPEGSLNLGSKAGIQREQPSMATNTVAERLIEDMSQSELRSILMQRGGNPSVRRKKGMVNELHKLGLYYESDAANIAERQSYRQWISVQLCRNMNLTYHMDPKRSRALAVALSVGQLEKLYGLMVRGIDRTQQRRQQNSYYE